MKQRARFGEQLRQGAAGRRESGAAGLDLRQAALSRDDARLLLDAGLATFLLHVEARIASLLGEGLHDRPVRRGAARRARARAARRRRRGAALPPPRGAARARAARRPRRGGRLLDRARAFVCSARDPVTGGVHCSLGGGPHDFLVTSTPRVAWRRRPSAGRSPRRSRARPAAARAARRAPSRWSPSATGRSAAPISSRRSTSRGTRTTAASRSVARSLARAVDPPARARCRPLAAARPRAD